MTAASSVLRYPGGKTRLAPWIVSQLPPHTVYLEPFCGSCAVFLRKDPAPIEVLNDLDGRVVNLFRVMRERPEDLARAVALTPYARAEYEASDEAAADELEQARRFLIRVQMAHAGKLGSDSGWRNGWAGGNQDRWGSSAYLWQRLPDRIIAVAARLRGAMIDNRPALELLEHWRVDGAVVYADPPFPRAALSMDATSRNGRRQRGRYYAHEMTDEEHVSLIDVLDQHPGPVLLSGYRCSLYDERLSSWTRLDRATRTYFGHARTESLWLNPAARGRRQDLFSGMEVPNAG